MNTLFRRVKALEKALKTKSNDCFIAVFRDGRRVTIRAPDAIDHVKSCAGELLRFEECDSETNNGLLSLLCNGLLEGGEV